MTFKFRAFKELSTSDGFNYPVDVYNDTVYLGTLKALPDAFVIMQIDTPKGKRLVAQSEKNKFKSQNLAAEVLFRTWQQLRKT